MSAAQCPRYIGSMDNTRQTNRQKKSKVLKKQGTLTETSDHYGAT